MHAMHSSWIYVRLSTWFEAVPRECAWINCNTHMRPQGMTINPNSATAEKPLSHALENYRTFIEFWMVVLLGFKSFTTFDTLGWPAEFEVTDDSCLYGFLKSCQSFLLYVMFSLFFWIVHRNLKFTLAKYAYMMMWKIPFVMNNSPSSHNLTQPLFVLINTSGEKTVM